MKKSLMDLVTMPWATSVEGLCTVAGGSDWPETFMMDDAVNTGMHIP
jgi:hypothetical protein